MKNNQITHLPDNIGDLLLLRVLDMEENQLKEIPQSLHKCQRLRRLNMRHEIAGLERLDLRWNHQLNIPKWLGELEERGCIIYL